MENTKCFKEFMKYSSLNVLGMIGLSCYILADTFFVSKGLGTNGLAALNLAIPIYSFIHGTGLMLGMGGATKYSILKSQGKKNDANDIFTHTVQSAALLSIAFFLCGLFFSNHITKTLGADGEIYQMTRTYLQVIMLFSPMFIMNDVLICFVRNDGNPKLSMIAMITGSFSNVILDYIFIFPLSMGIFGAVFATGLAPIFSMMILSLHIIKKNNQFHIRQIKLSPKITSAILSVGFPSLITEVSSGIVMIIFNMIILKLQGNVGVAAYGVIANLSLVVISIFTGIAQGIQPLISKAHGSNNTKNIKKLSIYSSVSILILSIFVYMGIFFGSDWIVQVFNSENNLEMKKIAVTGLKLYFTAVFFVSFNIIISVFFTSTDNPIPAHIISILRGFLLIIPMAFLLSSFWGITGVWLTLPITEFFVFIIGILLYSFYKKRHHS